MKYAVKFYSQVENPEGVPGTWPAVTINGPDTLVVPEGFTAMTEAEHAAYVAAHQAEYDAWVDDASSTKLSLAQKVRDRIDTRTDELIAIGFTYQDMHFKLDLEHQNSYMFDYLLNSTYPHTVKGVGDDYITFSSRNEHTAFIGTGFGTADTLIRGGWTLKDALAEMTYAQLAAWTDPRG